MKALASSSAIDRVLLLQRRLDLEDELGRLGGDSQADLDGLEADFIAALPSYSDRKHLSYAAWREAGVPARVLRAAGLRRAGG